MLIAQFDSYWQGTRKNPNPLGVGPRQGPLYYYPSGVASEIREYEEEMPKNAILVHLTASAEVIQRRMETDPHEYSLIQKEDIPMLLDRFQEEFAFLIPNKIQIDTYDDTGLALLQTVSIPIRSICRMKS